MYTFLKGAKELEANCTGKSKSEFSEDLIRESQGNSKPLEL